MEVFLKVPKKVVKGTGMGLPDLATAQQHADVIADLEVVAEQ